MQSLWIFSDIRCTVVMSSHVATADVLLRGCVETGEYKLEHMKQLALMKKTKENYHRNNCTVSDFAAASMMTNENLLKSDLIRMPEAIINATSRP